MAQRPPVRKLLVEGDDDKRVIPELIEANGVPWVDSRGDWIVSIEPMNGFEPILAAEEIETQLKASGLKALGIIVDANDDAAKRWSSVRERCVAQFPDLPESLPTKGVIATNPDGLKLGVWIMPDNESCGMMETFLKFLVPDPDDPILSFATKARDEAKTLGAPFKDAHADKAVIHTWLAWQDPPGRQLHDAIVQKILDPKSPHAAPFVRWFRSLYAV